MGNLIRFLWFFRELYNFLKALLTESEAERVADFSGDIATRGLKIAAHVEVDELAVDDQHHLPSGLRYPAHDAVQADAVGNVVVLDEILPVPGRVECDVDVERRQPAYKAAVRQLDIVELKTCGHAQVFVRTPVEIGAGAVAAAVVEIATAKPQPAA